MTAILNLFIWSSFTAWGNTSPANLVTLPIEVIGVDGTTRNVVVSVPAGKSKEARCLWLQVHGLQYNDLASIAINDSDWVPLNNKSVLIAEPGRSYGGIGGGFATLKLSLALPGGIVKDGTNCIHFRFNKTDGVVDGFRVVAFNFMDGQGKPILPDEAFVQEDPSDWKPPLNNPADIAAGAKLWQNAPLKANSFLNAPAIRAHCRDCHTSDGRDLKYFNYSNASVIARSRFHGLSTGEGEQIASYIRSLAVPKPDGLGTLLISQD